MHSVPAEAASAPAYPPHVVPNTELRVLPRTRPDRLYQLQIALPADFKKHPEMKYPVVFVADGYWAFTTVAAICANLTYGKNVPPMLVVGLGYAGDNPDYDKLRGTDLLPVTSHGSYETDGAGAKEFLAMIETSAIPLLEKDYRADPAHRYLMGCSAGGAFALYAMLTRPELFQGYVADSPWVDAVWNVERQAADEHRITTARVFISSAENEWTYYRQQIGVFTRRLEADGLVKGGLESHRVPNVRHAAGQPESYTQGLLFVTEPIAPERGIWTDWLTDSQKRPGFAVNFWTKIGAAGAALASEQEQAWQAHEAYAAKLLAAKLVDLTTTSPSESSYRSSSLVVFAADRAAVEELAREDPAVKSGLLNYEVIQAAE